MKKEEIIQFFEENVDLLSKFYVKEIGLFGSFIKSNETEFSDIDILVQFDEKGLTLRNYMGLKFLLEKKFGRKVDLVTKEDLKPLLRNEILSSVQYAKIN